MEAEHKATESLIRQIVEAVDPLRILLFGSAARGELCEESDLDLLVVMPEGVHRRRTAQKLYRKIRDVGVAFDILVATPADLEMHKENVGLIYRTILRESKEIYAAT
jgi:predicted nucleotidyltransferase